MARKGEPPISELVGQMVEDGKAYARAEIDLAKAKASAEGRRMVARYRVPALLFGLSLAFATAAVTTLCVLVAIAIAERTGPIAGGLLGFVFATGVAGILFFLARKGLEEKE